MEYLGAWVLFSLLVAAWANSLGKSWVAWLVLSLLISPLIAGVILGMTNLGGGAPVVGVADELTKLGALRDAGTITDDEYQRQRDRLLPP